MLRFSSDFDFTDKRVVKWSDTISFFPGKDRVSSYVLNHSNITDRAAKDRITAVRRFIFDELGDTRLSLLIATESLFIHVGTAKEYLRLYAADPLLREIFTHERIGGRSNVTFSRISCGASKRNTSVELKDDAGGRRKEVPDHSRAKKDGDRSYGDDESSAAIDKSNAILANRPGISGCVMSSVIDSSLVLPFDSILEFCFTRGSIQIGVNSIISHNFIDASLFQPETLRIPDHFSLSPPPPPLPPRTPSPPPLPPAPPASSRK